MNVNQTQAQVDVATPDGITVQIKVTNSLASMTLRTPAAKFETMIGDHENKTRARQFGRAILPWLSRFLMIGGVFIP